LNDILEIEFQLGYNLHWQDLDHKDFYQVMWQYDRLIKQKNMEQHGSDGNNLLSNGIEGFNTEMGKLDG
jgi:hypothetical protein